MSIPSWDQRGLKSFYLEMVLSKGDESDEEPEDKGKSEKE